MFFSEKEKELIRLFSEGKIETVADFMSQCFSFKKQKNEEAHFVGNHLNVNCGDMVSVIEDVDDLCSQIHTFIALTSTLSDMGLITEIKTANFVQLPNLFVIENSKLKMANVALTILSEIRNVVFHPNKHLLGQFIADGFLTETELRYAEEHKARERAQKTTLCIAIASIVVSTLTAVGTSIFNYKMSTIQRRVQIENLPEMPSPLPVIIKCDATLVHQSNSVCLGISEAMPIEGGVE